MRKVLIFQNHILEYRKPVYNALADRYRVTVHHSGCRSVTPQDKYNEVIAAACEIGPLILQRGVLRQVLLGDYDVLVIMFDLRWVCNLLPLLLRGDRGLVLWGHRYSGNQVVNRLRDLCMHSADISMLYGDEEIETIVARGGRRRKLVVAPNTVHIPNHENTSEREKCSFLFSGRLQYSKRVDQLIRAFSQVTNSIPPHIELQIVGDGPERVRLMDLADKLGIAHRTHFLGEVLDDKKLKEVFGRALAYVSPGPIGLAALHSFAYGVPVVTNRNCRHGPEFENLVDGRNAFIYEQEEHLAAMLLHVVRAPHKARQLGNAGYNLYVNERSLDRMIAGFQRAIEGAAFAHQHG